MILLGTGNSLEKDDTWPESVRFAVLEVLTPQSKRIHSKSRRQAALAAGINQYEQAAIEYPDWPRATTHSPLARRVRGWLKRVSEGLPAAR